MNSVFTIYLKKSQSLFGSLRILLRSLYKLSMKEGKNTVHVDIRLNRIDNTLRVRANKNDSWLRFDIKVELHFSEIQKAIIRF